MPPVEIGGHPILWHIVKIFGASGITDFVICCGYKGAMIKRYFTEYGPSHADFLVDLAANRIEINRALREPWRVPLVDTGQQTMTGGRLRRVRPYLDNPTF